ncbi:MAG: ribose-5-phosphate isomerase RpiA [Anaerolineales bacterium]
MVNDLKRAAAARALAYVSDGMTLGLGTGSTIAFFLELLSERLHSGALKDVRGVPTSDRTAAAARELGIPLTGLSDTPKLNLAVDGADEVDPDRNLIKGLGRALLREKIIATHAARFVVIVDDSKRVPRLGRGPLPVEIVKFEAGAHVRWLNSVCTTAELWLESDGRPVETDNGNYLVRCHFERGIPDPAALARLLADRPGIVEHGLFIGMAATIVIAGGKGVEIIGE